MSIVVKFASITFLILIFISASVSIKLHSNSNTHQEVNQVDDEEIEKDPDFESFKKFKEINRKNYKGGKKEEKKRFQNFKKNKDRLEKEKNEKKNKHYKLKLNKFADLDKNEFKKRFLNEVDVDYSKIPKGLIRGKAGAVVKENFSLIELAPINWVERGFVTPVEDQMDCGSCWAFGAAGMLESRYAISQKKPLVPFSKQELIDCVTPLTGFPGSCNGGSHIFALYFSFYSNMIIDEEYTYNAYEDHCRILPGSDLENKGVLPFFQAFDVHPTVTQEKLYSILQNGPVAINIDASPDDFVYYESGILRYECEDNRSNHIVLLVGYGFDPESSKHYWIIKNSWSTWWGENGFARIEKTPEWDGCFMLNNVAEIN